MKPNSNKLAKYLNTLTYDLSGKEYHETEGTYSSSQMKDMLADPEFFHKKYITKEVEKTEGAHFDIGTHFHTAVLEPHNLEKECIVFNGARRAGKDWEAFKVLHADKTIITSNEKETSDNLVKAINSSPVCMSYLKDGKAEVSAFMELLVFAGDIFAKRNDVYYTLQTAGWVQSTLDFDEADIEKHAVRLIVKARADYLSTKNRFISDLKSTTGNAKSGHSMQEKVNSWQYDLSASMYLDIFSFCSGEDIEDFLLLFASKDMGNAKAYKISEKNKMVGRNKWRKAVLDLAFYTKNKWKFSDSLGEIGPSFYSLEWLEEDKCKALPEIEEAIEEDLL